MGPAIAPLGTSTRSASAESSTTFAFTKPPAPVKDTEVACGLRESKSAPPLRTVTSTGSGVDGESPGQPKPGVTLLIVGGGSTSTTRMVIFCGAEDRPSASLTTKDADQVAVPVVLMVCPRSSTVVPSALSGFRDGALTKA